ncbi:UPF0500 protein C1orf216 homolog [Protopterus annectens]|uniref:UPF0500 protein C1orf216 homolog n=1 Tax=Protopterus annectens TaxID=7888 RepID=UPI001CFB683C|nr:UPF0500 protein C1orf216 homolog [Protopterus annectens]XP_043915895.1 UPF0500 protein C1orf216 homolog [Protopterus annectens]XP_043915896.1 UPF0500 protein C1orf216 homolog [Protopterus annectens]
MSQNSALHEGNLSSKFICARDYLQDKNCNFLGKPFENNENLIHMVAEMNTETIIEQSKNCINLLEKHSSYAGKEGMENKLNGVLKAVTTDELNHSPSECGNYVPEGTDICSTGKQNIIKCPAKDECNKSAGSPLEDIGYASSSLSIDSPDSSTGNVWEGEGATIPDKNILENEIHSNDADSDSSSDSETLLPTILEAVQDLQDHKIFKEREKEKHQVQLIMYRRLALLRWIRSLQQKVIDQQNRLQASYDTILDNRKELLKYIRRGTTLQEDINVQN